MTHNLTASEREAVLRSRHKVAIQVIVGLEALIEKAARVNSPLTGMLRTAHFAAEHEARVLASEMRPRTRDERPLAEKVHEVLTHA